MVTPVATPFLVPMANGCWEMGVVLNPDVKGLTVVECVPRHPLSAGSQWRNMMR